MTPAVVYLRTATEKSDTSQRDACQQVCIEQDLSVLEIVSEVASGIDPDRPGLKRVLDYARSHEVGAVVVSSPDRLSRNYGQLQSILKTFADSGVKLYVGGAA